MPRGNDSANAVAELADRLGLGDARAEDLVEHHRRSMSERLQAAQLLPINEKATAEIDWTEAAKAVDIDPESVHDVGVRGDTVIVVWEGEDGRIHKSDCAAEDAGIEINNRAASRREQKLAARAKAQGKPAKSDD